MPALLTVLAVMLPLQGESKTEAALPLVEYVDCDDLRGQVGHILEALDALKAPLPKGNTQALKALAKVNAGDPQKTAEAIQKLLDRHCLIGVTINPESRVKAARGAAAAELKRNCEAVVLIKIQNDGGVTHSLGVTGPQIREGKASDRQRWLEARLYTRRPMREKLSGQKLEYVILRLTAHETGKREATLKFDVGQGTQDLGFRAEVPVLFTVQLIAERP
jgi:hypothetical protein